MVELLIKKIKMSKTIIAVIVNTLSMVLPEFGITVGTEELTSTIQTIVAIVTGAWIWFERVQRHDVNFAGWHK